VTRAENKPYHVLINAENFHALQLLLYCREGQVDVIYIDPPYNTGARDWKYNNDYVDSTDQWRHSKWLSMMKKRLILARRLLKKDGVLIVTSDENEDATLTLLLRDVFPDAEITSIAIVHNPRGIQGDNFSYCHEIAHFVIPRGLKRIGTRKIPKDQQEAAPLRNWGGESTRDTGKNFLLPNLLQEGKAQPSRRRATTIISP
jgi:adenine-specific DNA-methyltransferase